MNGYWCALGTCTTGNGVTLALCTTLHHSTKLLTNTFRLRNIALLAVVLMTCGFPRLTGSTQGASTLTVQPYLEQTNWLLVKQGLKRTPGSSKLDSP